jgi:hypothetical protein
MRTTSEGNGLYEVSRCHEIGEAYLDARVQLQKPFDAAETEKVRTGSRAVETCDSADCTKIHFWSVYERQTWGGALCIADCPLEAYALGIASALEAK